jgi:hypothetical protein
MGESMPSLGAGFLALWNDHEQAGGDYDVWHTREHVAERLGIPGILSGRRYVDGSGSLSRYFTLYGLQNTAVLESDPYRQLLENPSPWSRQMRCSMSGFLRRGCRVLASYGGGVGGFAAVSFFHAEDEQKGKQILKDFRAHPAFTAVHLGLVDTSVTGVPLSVAGADRFDNRNAILVMEGYQATSLASAAEELSRELRRGTVCEMENSLTFYQLAFALDSEERLAMLPVRSSW